MPRSRFASPRVSARPLALSLALGTLAAAAPMGPARAALTPTQQACQQQVARRGALYFAAVAKALRRCEERIAKGSLPTGTDCGLEPFTAAAVQRAADRLAASLASRCDDATVASLPFGDDCYGTSDVASLATCEAGVHLDQARQGLRAVYDQTAATSGSARSCQRAVGRQSQRFAARAHRGLRLCRDKVSKGSLPTGADCEAEAAATVAKAFARAAERIRSKCTDATVASLAFGVPCAGVATVDGLIACALGAQQIGSGRLILAEYGSGAQGGAGASIRQIADASECIGGPLSRCRPGDYLLENGSIRVVVQSVQRNLLGIGQFGGQIIDADIVRGPGEAGRDSFEELATHLNIENTAHYTNLTIVNDGSDGQPAVLRATGVDDLLDFVNPSSTVAGFGFSFPAAADDQDLPVEVMTDYVLEPGRSYVRIETTVVNLDASPLDLFLGDYLNGSGQLEMFQTGYAFGEPLVGSPCPSGAANPCNVTVYAGYDEAAGVSYGYAHEIEGSSAFTTAGVSVALLGQDTALTLIGAQAPAFHLEPAGSPGDSLRLTRYFLVGDGTVDSVLRARNEAQFLATGTVSGTVTAGGVPAAGARVAVYGPSIEGPGGLTHNVVDTTLTDASGSYSLELPPGSYSLVVNLDGSPYQGGGSAPLENPVAVTAFQTALVDLALPATGGLRVTVTDETGSPIAAKASVVGFDPSPPALNSQSIFGLIQNTTGVFHDLEDALPFGVSQVLFLDPSGDSGIVPLEPGDYRIVVSHGPEYSIASADVSIAAGSTASVALQIARVVDTSGFIAGDFHVHSVQSPDSAISERQRVLSMLAEGVDFFTPSDHDNRRDFSSTVAALGVGSLISVAPSAEITTFDYGHFNAWPMVVDASLPNGGTVDHGGAAPAGQDFPSFGSYSLSPAEILAAAAADPGVDTVQINHIHSHFGLETGTGLAIDTGLTPPQSMVPPAVRRLDPALTNLFSDGFTALEVWIEANRSQILDNFLGRNAGDWFNLINQGIVRAGVADSDTHRTRIGISGFPRTMVASPTDDPGALAAIAETLAANVNAGRAIGTNGPMVRITTFAASTGQTGGLELGLPTEIATTDGSVDVSVEIQSPVWAPFDRVEFYVNPVTIRSTSLGGVGGGFPDVTVTRYGIAPDFVLTAGVDFPVSTVTVDPSVPGAERLEATATLSLSGLASDVWVVALVRGTDGVSPPLFPVVPADLDASSNSTLADLIDGNVGEGGVTALAFTNPLFVDVDGGGWTPPGVQFVP